MLRRVERASHCPFLLSFRNCPLLDSNLSQASQLLKRPINPETDPSAKDVITFNGICGWNKDEVQMRRR